jgi:hypothetical protein
MFVFLFVALLWWLGLRTGIRAFFLLFVAGYAALTRVKGKQD